MTLDALNVADETAFVAALGFIFEHSPWVAARTWPQRPFPTSAALHRAMCGVVAAATSDEQLALIRAHPDLVGQAARAGTLSPASTREQAAAGLDRLAPADVRTFLTLNRAYRDRFGFPFIVCVREHTRDAIVSGLRSRLSNDLRQEMHAALAEIEKIARLRLNDTLHV